MYHEHILHLILNEANCFLLQNNMKLSVRMMIHQNKNAYLNRTFEFMAQLRAGILNKNYLANYI